jgi:hypothetical protein
MRWFRGKLWRAHRAAWVEAHGDIPEGMFVLHQCDNRACVNVAHLFLGTHQDNMDDRESKGRNHPPHDPFWLREYNPEQRIKDVQTGVEYKSISEACRALDLHKTQMLRHLAGRSQTVKGKQFKRV